MILIAHRGNINGAIPERENSPDYIEQALLLGYHVEVDIRYIAGKLWLGHDEPTYEVSYSFLSEDMWLHCKNIDALEFLSQDSSLNVFFHGVDDAVLTSRGYLWTAPGFQITPRSIAVMPELVRGWMISKAIGICTDHVAKYNNEYNIFDYNL